MRAESFLCGVNFEVSFDDDDDEDEDEEEEDEDVDEDAEGELSLGSFGLADDEAADCDDVDIGEFDTYPEDVDSGELAFGLPSIGLVAARWWCAWLSMWCAIGPGCWCIR